jgi:hypothetical protein
MDYLHLSNITKLEGRKKKNSSLTTENLQKSFFPGCLYSLINVGYPWIEANKLNHSNICKGLGDQEEDTALSDIVKVWERWDFIW